MIFSVTEPFLWRISSCRWHHSCKGPQVRCLISSTAWSFRGCSSSKNPWMKFQYILLATIGSLKTGRNQWKWVGLRVDCGKNFKAWYRCAQSLAYEVLITFPSRFLRCFHRFQIKARIFTLRTQCSPRRQEGRSQRLEWFVVQLPKQPQS